MPIRWNVPQHASTLEQLDAALGDGTLRGAVVLGPDGVGKSTLARLAAEHFGSRNPDTFIRWVTGTPTERVVPFGAFSHVVDIADIGKPAALLRAARASLSRDRQGDLLLIVDDAHDLDILSATLVYQLALAGTARMIVTARADAAPEAIAALWTDGLLDRIDVDAPGEATSPAEVDTFITELPAAARAVLDYLAVEEPLSLADLTVLAGDGAVAEAQEWGAAETRVRDERADDPVVYTAHPLFSERARTALGADGARQRRTELVTLQSQQPMDHLSDRLRLASLALDSDAPQPVADVVDAAQQALRLGDLTLGERLARSATDRSDALAARLPLANSLAFQGRGREAEALLAAVDSAALSDAELMTWTLLRAANQFFMLSEPERATAFLQTIRNRVPDVGPRLTLDALSSTFAMNAGNIERAVEIAHAVLASPAADDQAVAWAASAATLCSARQGRFADVEPAAQRALGAEHPGLLRFTVGLGETTTLLMAGRLDTATELAQQFTDFAELQQPGRAIGEVLLAHVLIAAGRFGEATALLGPAATALERTGYSWGPLSLMLLATALAQQGDIAGAAKALSRAESRHGTKSALFSPELGVARAWRLAAERDSHGAIAAARDAARMAERRGQSAVALRVWHEAVRLGDIRAVDPLARLCDEVDCELGRLALAHAKALATSDGAALGAVAEELTAAGLHAAAATAAAQAQQGG
ncbi:AAA family ATPase [Mycobacterium montefiorense]|uniref:ATPase AAA n=1 Tax=Mycobacterium montefiorense TaxID=154654 RepID=A0AA37UWA3_9MYCO|nr:AAA family ATPase [Mycobacterium montefiorense]GBG37537.1 ATPase AAA [Mycobacterium montefiorense]GKU36154.1 ATPase AAA [Mycobacterium montefiorense]GKU41628.1 ATPase AAA [Mycobacterium montefiorense]GKU47372.1 ATPase AAA [Mycobacterium montefiorense]GKU55684.1 ATPase AAA [Mycobacterium montefiorense]